MNDTERRVAKALAAVIARRGLDLPAMARAAVRVVQDPLQGQQPELPLFGGVNPLPPQFEPRWERVFD